MSEAFSRTFTVGWGDMDFNSHMRNTAYLDYSGTTRMMYFDAQGFSMREFERLQFGPVITRDELAYFKELRLLEPITVDLTLAGLSADGARFRFRNTFRRSDGKVAATVTSTGGWLSFAERRLAPPPEDLAAIIRTLPHTEDYAEIDPGAPKP